MGLSDGRYIMNQIEINTIMTVNTPKKTMTQSEMPGQTEQEIVTRQQWKWSALAGMASYLDAGSIVALAAGLALFQTYLGLTATDVGALAAIGPNALGCAIGSVIGGRLGDKLGRKRIYQYDLLVYAAGILCIALGGSGIGVGDCFRQGDRRYLPRHPHLSLHQPHALS